MSTKAALNKRWQSGDNGLAIERLPAKESFKSRAYAALKEAITNMNIYGSDEPLLLDERDISERLGASRTPIREAVAMLEQEGLLKAVPRRGILVVRRTKAEMIEMIEAWAALESMAARLATSRASDEAIAELRAFFKEFDFNRIERERCDEYSTANIAFHQALIRLSGSSLLAAMTDNLFFHVRAIRHRTIFEMDRAQRSASDHLEIIQAIEARDADRAERLVRDHTLRLARHVESHVNLD
ncbi:MULTISPECIES: GntR family transcriptional regulator [Ancylobacter]|uniref:Transcriptional regulator n=1 Tax=Ancylobacter defluvii TaxID=1282440 RepID=A0A9W6N954_9HYPH|nr:MULTISPECIES: GntR family transcriptional regulator [Ancylobacter]MBS7587417.1 GntR family transcriptional regulator [Ancylobacter defluvii]MDR6952089.1 DNA-binding GntR family transcriptional regulator [Ancylobacter sp. 3268]GLK82107.1 transcriptional regulator [Ancylobacter defluvii]